MFVPIRFWKHLEPIDIRNLLCIFQRSQKAKNRTSKPMVNSILVGGLEPWNFMTFHSVGNVIPTDFHSIIFQRRSTSNQRSSYKWMGGFSPWRPWRIGNLEVPKIQSASPTCRLWYARFHIAVSLVAPQATWFLAKTENWVPQNVFVWDRCVLVIFSHFCSIPKTCLFKSPLSQRDMIYIYIYIYCIILYCIILYYNILYYIIIYYIILYYIVLYYIILYYIIL